MLKSKKPKPIGLFVPKDTHQKGDLHIEGRVRIEGRFTGNLEAEDSVVITPSGCFSGTCNATNIEVYGECDGKIRTSDRFSLRKGGRFTGLLDTNRLTIEDQSSFLGELRVAGEA